MIITNPASRARRSIELVIFDCDGVLVDSEMIATRTLVRVAQAYGFEIKEDQALARFKGQKLANNVAHIEQTIGRSLPEDFVGLFRKAMYEAFIDQLLPIKGIEAALAQISHPICVASSGPREKIELTLKLTGLLPLFKGRIFSAYEVGCWKPDPGLFLEAAQILGIRPDACVVVEDSLPGVQAGIAANMRVLAYTPDGDDSDFASLGAEPFEAMNMLPKLIDG